MAWKPIDFQGIVSLDKALIDNLRKYLEEKESQLGNNLIYSIHTYREESIAPLLPPSEGVYLRLNDTIEVFGKRMRQIIQTMDSRTPANDWQGIASQINIALWDYVEILEGCVTELFQQVSQVKFEMWHSELAPVVEEIKEILEHQIEDVSWAIRRVEAQLNEYRWACESKHHKMFLLKKFFLKWQSILDRSLLSNLKNSQEFLDSRYKIFSERFEHYMKLKGQIEESVHKFEGYLIFGSLEPSTQKLIKDIYKHLKLWRKNDKLQILPKKDTFRALRTLTNPDKAISLFKEYYEHLRAEVFDRSRYFKESLNESLIDQNRRATIQQVLNGQQKEVHTLGAMVTRYREFLLRTDPDPYVRTRWGFSEWVVGEEPTQAQQLLNLSFEIEHLENLFNRLIAAAEKGPSREDGIKIVQNKLDIQHALHEMGQPLISKKIMYAKAEDILKSLQDLDELGSFNPDIVEYVGKILSKALRFDWKYHVFHEINLFYEIYHIHQGIVGPIQDRKHENRMNKFKHLFQRMSKWVKQHDVFKHTHEVDEEIHDTKETLQDFYAYVQRTSKETEGRDEKEIKILIANIAQQLLEYRFIFGKFFKLLSQNEPEEEIVRGQFLFVHQYFESIENVLHSLRRHNQTR